MKSTSTRGGEWRKVLAAVAVSACVGGLGSACIGSRTTPCGKTVCSQGEECDAVHEVCVVGRETDDKLVKPLAYVVPTPGHPGDEALQTELVAHLKAKLAPHKYPRWFAWREELPRNDRGKIARSVLAAEANRIDL